MVKKWEDFHKVTEDSEEDMKNRLYGTGDNPKRDLVTALKDLVSTISKSNPATQEDFDNIKMDIKEKKERITSHADFNEFKQDGFEWQDQVIKASDWEKELRDAVVTLYKKATKKGFV
jgi:hypothetical protein